MPQDSGLTLTLPQGVCAPPGYRETLSSNPPPVNNQRSNCTSIVYLTRKYQWLSKAHNCYTTPKMFIPGTWQHRLSTLSLLEYYKRRKQQCRKRFVPLSTKVASTLCRIATYFCGAERFSHLTFESVFLTIFNRASGNSLVPSTVFLARKEGKGLYHGPVFLPRI